MDTGRNQLKQYHTRFHDKMWSQERNFYLQTDGGGRHKGTSATGWRLRTTGKGNTANTIAEGGTIYNENMSSLDIEAYAMLEALRYIDSSMQQARLTRPDNDANNKRKQENQEATQQAKQHKIDHHKNNDQQRHDTIPQQPTDTNRRHHGSHNNSSSTTTCYDTSLQQPTATNNHHDSSSRPPMDEEPTRTTREPFTLIDRNRKPHKILKGALLGKRRPRHDTTQHNHTDDHNHDDNKRHHDDNKRRKT